MNLLDTKISIKNIIFKIGTFIFAFLVILNTRSAYMHIKGHENISFIIFTMLLIVTAMCLCVSNLDIKKIKLSIISSIVIMGLFFLHYLTTSSEFDGTIKNGVMLCCCVVYFCCCINYDECPLIFKYYKLIIVFICIISLLFWYFGSVKGLIPYKYVFSNWTGTGEYQRIKSYFGIYFERQKNTDLFTKNFEIRNQAFFTEAPMSSLHFSVALMISALFNKNIRTKVIESIVLILGIISSVSSTGYIFILLLFGLIIIVKGLKSNKRIFFALFVPLIMIVVYVLVMRLVGNKLESDSGKVRLDDFIIGFKVWKNNIFFGVGMQNSKPFRDLMGIERANNIGYSNSLMQLLGQCGLLFFIPIFIFNVLSIKKAVKNKEWNLLIFIILFDYLFIFTIITYNLLTMLVFVWCFITNYKSDTEIENDELLLEEV